jgi:predicted outer membrane repeat protein
MSTKIERRMRKTMNQHKSRLPIAVSFAIIVLLGTALLGNSRAASALEHNPLSRAKNVLQAISAAEPSCVVNVHGGADYTKIQDAINDANCLTITVAAGIYVELLNIRRDITIIGDGIDKTIIDPNKAGTVVIVSDPSITTGPNVFISNVTLRDGNGFGPGGGIVNTGILHLTNVAVINNITGNDGGGISNAGTLFISDSIISDNQASIAAGIDSVGPLFIVDTIISNNKALYSYGGITLRAAKPATLINVTISGNTGYRGGGITNGGTMTILNSTIISNTGMYAAGIFNGGSMTIVGSTVSGNTGFQGAGISSGVALTVTNSTISGNSGEYDAGIFPYSDSHVFLNNVTIADNISTTSGGAISAEQGYFTLKNTLVSHNIPNGNCSGTRITSSGGNLSSDGSCNFTQSSDKQNIDPKLGPLQDNGGPTFTHALESTSPAIDTGVSPGCPLNDQRGIARPTDGDGNNKSACDIGAFEFPGTYLNFLGSLMR